MRLIPKAVKRELILGVTIRAVVHTTPTISVELKGVMALIAGGMIIDELKRGLKDYAPTRLGGSKLIIKAIVD